LSEKKRKKREIKAVKEETNGEKSRK